MEKGKGQGRSSLGAKAAGSQAGGVLILCDNTTERLCDNTPEKAALLCNMLWSQRPYEVVMSFTRSKPGPRAVRRIGRYLSGTTHPTLLPIGGRPREPPSLPYVRLSPHTARTKTPKSIPSFLFHLSSPILDQTSLPQQENALGDSCFKTKGLKHSSFEAGVLALQLGGRFLRLSYVSLGFVPNQGGMMAGGVRVPTLVPAAEEIAQESEVNVVHVDPSPEQEYRFEPEGKPRSIT
nr:unnamed protein product [Digitaria exilis]